MIRFLLAFLFLCSQAFAAQVTVPTSWNNGDVVTAAKLNNINNAFATALNGGLDNTNANATGGFHFFKTVATLDSPGTQGTVEFQLSDNSLNLDNGSAWLQAITPTGTLGTGKIPYYNGGWTLLSPGAQYLPLISNGLTSLPSYQILPTAGGGTGQDFSSGTSGDYLYFSSTGVIGHTPLIHGAQVFTSSGTFPVPGGVTKVSVTLIGGGGGGGGTSSNSAGGGGGGSMYINYPYTVVPSSNYTVTIGAGGIAGDASNGTGGTGGTTSFDALSAVGGNGGVGGAGGAGGTGGGGLNANANTAGGSLAGGTGGTGSTNSGGGGGTLIGSGAAGKTVDGVGNSASANTGAGGGGARGGGAAGGVGGSGLCVVIY